MILSNSMMLALVLLLLPVPLAFLIPASSAADPDPWKIRRMRTSVVGFALSVALIQIAMLWFQERLFDGSPPQQPAAPFSRFVQDGKYATCANGR